MSKSVQLQILREEEKVLRDIEAKLKDQLNRLKVEELTLVNQLRGMEEDQAAEELDPQGQMDMDLINASDTVGAQVSQETDVTESINTKPLLDLDVNKQLLMLGKADDEMEEEEEEEEEEEDYEEEDSVHDQLTAFMKRLERDATS